ncbi:MAG: hypothetical protein ACXWC9_11140 [Pseudobdellovibrionaceae bacterium]
MNKAPEQNEVQNASQFQVEKGSHFYSIQPKANYKIWGLVVATHDSSSWMDITHQQAGDFFNTHDICVIWGENASSQYLKKWKFSHGDWTCYVQTNSMKSWKAFRGDQLSNNHILPQNAEVLDVIRSAQVGDQIEISGQLVDYSTDDGPPRKTSLIRTDTENGACEIIYATGARFLARPPLIWRALEKLSLLSIGAGILLMLFGAGALPYLQTKPPDDPI